MGWDWVLGFHVTTHWRILASLCGLSLVISVLTCLDRELVWGRLLRRSSTASLSLLAWYLCDHSSQGSIESPKTVV